MTGAHWKWPNLEAGRFDRCWDAESENPLLCSSHHQKLQAVNAEVDFCRLYQRLDRTAGWWHIVTSWVSNFMNPKRWQFSDSGSTNFETSPDMWWFYVYWEWKSWTYTIIPNVNLLRFYQFSSNWKSSHRVHWNQEELVATHKSSRSRGEGIGWLTEASFRTSWNKYSWSLADIHSKMNDHSFSSFHISTYICTHYVPLWLSLVRLYKQGQGDSESNIFSTWQIRCQLSVRELFFRFVWINFCFLATFCWNLVVRLLRFKIHKRDGCFKKTHIFWGVGWSDSIFLSNKGWLPRLAWSKAKSWINVDWVHGFRVGQAP